MISTYSEYIERYVLRSGRSAPLPGEHHFVAAYLVPRLFTVYDVVPDYINPDGTKSVTGDVVYRHGSADQVSIEVKLETIRLTKNEFNSGIVHSVASKRPSLFLGVGSKGLVLTTWANFSEMYVSSVRQSRPAWIPAEIESGYGPQKQVDAVFNLFADAHRFPCKSDQRAAKREEDRFMTALASRLSATAQE